MTPRSLAVEKVVDIDVLQQGHEHKEQAHQDIDVDGLDTGNVGSLSCRWELMVVRTGIEDRPSVTLAAEES